MKRIPVYLSIDEMKIIVKSIEAKDKTSSDIVEKLEFYIEQNEEAGDE